MRFTRGLVLLAALISCGAVLLPGGGQRPTPMPRRQQAAEVAEVRALWVTRSTLTSAESIRTMVDSAVKSGFNTLLVQVRGRGDSYFNGGREPRADALARQPSGFDPLGSVLERGHASGLRVHAWVNVGLVSNAVELPRSPTHVVNRHPEWLMVPRALAREMAVLDPRTHFYRDKLARWTRTQPQQVEGLYVSPIVPAAADYTAGVIGDIASRYPVDGVHLDYVRYPDDEFDCSPAAVEEFRNEVVAGIPDTERAIIDRRRAKNPLAYVEAFPERWHAFRVSRLTALVERLSREIRTRRPGAAVTAAVVPPPSEARERRLQDWPAWLAGGLLDAVCPMAYATESSAFEAQMKAASDGAAGGDVWAGIGAYRISPSQTIENIRIARRLGASGIVLFSYDSLVTPARGAAGYLEDVARAAFDR
ncbi:MAG: glycoside hydrolase family 10 protein [Vicinamibacterales bacterium]